jgi:SurA-like protein
MRRRRRRFQAAAFLLLLVVAPSARAGEVIDQIVAVVDKRVILQSDWDIEIRCEAFLDSKSLASVTPEQKTAALDRLIDQALIEEQVGKTDFIRATPAEIDVQVGTIRKQRFGETTEEAWRAALAAYGLDQEAVADRIQTQLDILHFVDLRFRPSIHVDPVMVANYYRDTFLPELKKQGVSPPPLQLVETRIEAILVEQETDKLLSNWLRALRTQADVRRITPQAEVAEDGRKMP